MIMMLGLNNGEQSKLYSTSALFCDLLTSVQARFCEYLLEHFWYDVSNRFKTREIMPGTHLSHKIGTCPNKR